MWIAALAVWYHCNYVISDYLAPTAPTGGGTRNTQEQGRLLQFHFQLRMFLLLIYC
jgi:hypothetical protein